MRYKVLMLLVVIMSGFGLTALQAQSLYVKESAGIQNTFSLSNISKISFSSGQLIISQDEKSSVTYPLSTLQYLSFSDFVSGNSEVGDIEESVTKMYPNPVYNDLKIDLSGTDCTKGTLNILSLDAKLLKSQQISGPGVISLDMSHFIKGIYICQLSYGDEKRAIKIIKQ